MSAPRLYRWLLRALPREFRTRFGADMGALFADRLREASGPIGRGVIWMRAVGDIAVHAFAEHRGIWRRRRREAGMDWRSLRRSVAGIERDIGFAARVLLRDRTFTITALLTLVLCLGGNAAIFSIVRSVLLRPLPMHEADRVMLLANLYPKAGFSHAGPSEPGASYPDFLDRQRDTRAFSDLALYRRISLTLGRDDGAIRIDALFTTPSFFGLLHARPLLGRALAADDGQLGNDAKVVLAYGFWQRQFGGDPGIVGRDVALGGRPYRVVGVMPREFQFLWRDIDLYAPLAFTPAQAADASRHSNNWMMIARLRPGATVDQAQREIDALNARNDERFPQFRSILHDAGFRTQVSPLADEVVREVRPTLYLLWGGVGLVLLVGAVNLANLVLVRASGRARELATRSALGAGGARLARQLVTETVVLTCTGGVFGIAAGWWVLRSLGALHLEMLPRGDEIRLDWVGATAMLALATAVGIVTGLVPVAQMRRTDLAAALRDGGRSGSGGARAGRVRRGLATAQVAFAFVLLMGAGLLAASFRAVTRVDPGFSATGVLTASVALPRATYPGESTLVAGTERLLSQLRAIPGVARVGATTTIPFGGYYNSSVILAEGHRMQPGETLISPHYIEASDGYFEAMRIPLVRGRSFDARDTRTSNPVVIVDERLARRFWPDRDAVGRRVYPPGDPQDLLAVGPNTRYLTVIGVAKNVPVTGLAPSDPLIGAYYLPLSQSPNRTLVFAIRSDRAPASLVPAVREAIRSVDRGLAVFDVQTMDERLDHSLVGRRVPMLLGMAFALVALFLAAVGIYGVLAYQVSQRRREIGIRVALGSSTRRILGLVMGDGARITGFGLVLGSAGVVAMARVIRGLLFGVGPTDPRVIALVAVLLSAVAAVATLIPARRAARVSPTEVIAE